MPLRELLGGALGLFEELEAQSDNASAHKQGKQRICGHNLPGNAQSGNNAVASSSGQTSNGDSLSRTATLLS